MCKQKQFHQIFHFGYENEVIPRPLVPIFGSKSMVAMVIHNCQKTLKSARYRFATYAYW